MTVVEFVASARRTYEGTLTDEQRRAVDRVITSIRETGTIRSSTPLPATPLGPAWRHRAGAVRVLVAGDDDVAWVLGFALRPQ